MAKRKRNGSALLEFTLVGIPVIFMLISIVEMARGMWIYHTLAYAVKEGTRYAVVHGQNYTAITGTNSTYQGVCTAIVNAGPGLLSNQLTLIFHSATAADVTATANSCTTGQWPPAGAGIPDNAPGQPISITAEYPFLSAISMFWPGAGRGITFKNLTCSGAGTLCLPAASQDVMQF